MSEALVKIEPHETALDRPSPREVIAQATEEANVLRDLIRDRQLFSVVQGKHYVRCEGWTTLAMLRGFMPREVSVEDIGDGVFVATVELVRIADGTVITRASAECGAPDELNHKGEPIWANRPRYARRSMAVTRATSKACRIAFSWVMALAGYEVTPAEEVPSGGFDDARPAQRPQPAAKPRPSQPMTPPPDGAPVWRGKLVNVETKTGTNKSGPWTLYTFIGHDGERFGTFDTKIAAAITALEKGFIEIVYETTAKGNQNIIEFRNVTSEEAPFNE